MSDSEGNLSQTNAIVVHSSSNQSCLNDGTSKSSSTTVIATDATTSTAGNAQTTGSAQPPSATSSPSPTQSFAGSISRSGTSSQSNPTSVSNGSPSLTLQNTSSPGMSTSTPVLVPTGANTTPKSSRSLGRVVGAAVGGSIGGLLLILLAVLILRRRIRRRRIQEIEGQRRRASRALLDTTEPFISIPEKGSKTDVSSLPVTTRTPTNTRSAPSPPSANVDPPPGPSSVPTRNELQQPSATVPRREPGKFACVVCASSRGHHCVFSGTHGPSGGRCRKRAYGRGV
ncbi:hypothetical protein GY45DRAFT_36959 [Cubamyces sp. BRFM 1775]|nr:hypothetical protein GY45DRAFT_36959 [Cubamyces sp. BRFM 1775]